MCFARLSYVACSVFYDLATYAAAAHLNTSLEHQFRRRRGHVGFADRKVECQGLAGRGVVWCEAHWSGMLRVARFGLMERRA